MATESIIVYRNPAEEALWEAIMSPTGFAVLFGAFIALVVVLMVNEVAQRAFACSNDKAGTIALVLGIVSWVFMTAFLIVRV